MDPLFSKTQTPPPEWVLYDGECGFCLRWVERLGPWLQAQGFTLAPLQTPWVQKRLGLPPEQLLEEMRVITKTGQVLGGGDALLYVIQTMPWGQVTSVLTVLPGVKPTIRAAYRAIARRRHCLNGSCRIESHFHSSKGPKGGAI